MAQNKRRLATTLLRTAATLVSENNSESDRNAVTLMETAISTVKALGQGVGSGNGAVGEPTKGPKVTV